MKMTEVKPRFRRKCQDWQLSRTKPPIQSAKQLIMGRNKLLQNTSSASVRYDTRSSDLAVTRIPHLCIVSQNSALRSHNQQGWETQPDLKIHENHTSFHKLSHGSNYSCALVLQWYTQHLAIQISRNTCFWWNSLGKQPNICVKLHP